MNFKKLNIESKEEIKAFVQEYEPFSDYNFTSLYSYNVLDNAEFCFLNDNLIIKYPDYLTGDIIYSLLGNSQLDATLEELLNLTTELKLVPETTIKSGGSYLEKFRVTEDRDNHDYILDVEELATLAGSKYYDKRNLVNRFRKFLPEHTVRLLDLQSESEVNKVYNLFSLWKKQANRTDEETETELKAIKRVLDNSKDLDVFICGIFKQDILVGFSICEIMHNDFAMIHFEKADVTLPGIYSLIVHETAKILKERGVKYINYTQDLGIPGLRKAKELWRPVNFLKKYTISAK